MKASVIIPAYNASAWSKSLTESIRNNIEAIGEVLLINDGDVADFSKLANHISDCGLKDIRIHHTSGRQGPGSARNIGLEESTYPIIAFLDCDDIWLRSSLKTRITHLLANESCSFVYSSFYKITTDETKTNHICPPSTCWANDLLVTNHVFLSSVVLRKADLNGVTFKNIGHEDLLFWVELILKANRPALCLEQPVCLMRTTPHSVSSIKSRSAKWYWTIISQFNIPLPVKCLMFFVYALNAYAKRQLTNYRPFYCKVNYIVSSYLRPEADQYKP